MLTTSEIRTLIDNDSSSERKRFARKGQAYYDGDHDIKKIQTVLLQFRWQACRR